MSALLHAIAVGDTPATIAGEYTGDPSRFRELVDANPALPRAGGTFRELVEGQLLELPRAWTLELERMIDRMERGQRQRLGLGDLPQINGLPSSDDIVNQGVQAGTSWLASELGVPGNAANIVGAIVAVPVEAFAIFAIDTAAAATVNVAAAGVLTMLSTIAPELAASVAEVVGTALNVVPVLGAVVDVIGAVTAIVDAIEQPPNFNTEGRNGPVNLDVGYYVKTAIPQAVADAPKYLTMDPYAFSVQETISVNDMGLVDGGLVIVWGNPTLPSNYGGLLTVIPGAWSLLHAAQLSAAAATAPLVANKLAEYIGVTGPATLPLVTQDEWSQIFSIVEPITAAIIANAQAWADAQSPAPTQAAIVAKYGLSPAYAAQVVANYKAGAAAPAKTSTAAVVAGTALGAGALGAAIAFGVAAYKGVGVATVARDWYRAVRRAF